jgi:hypothetical protein
MKKILSAIAVAASATLPVFAALDPDCVLYYDFETLAEDGYTVENIANPGVMQLSGGNKGLATVVDAALQDQGQVRGPAVRADVAGTWRRARPLRMGEAC